MKRAADHDRYLGVIHSIARAEELEQKDKRKQQNKPEPQKTCFNCGKKKSCKKFNGKLTFEGSYSIGGDTYNETCNNWEQVRNMQNDPQKVKSLLKQFKKLK